MSSTYRELEEVLVFPRSVFQEIGVFQGLNTDADRYVERILVPSVATFVQRRKAEADPTLKQIIPYILVEHDGRLLRYIRGKGSGEKRLVSKGSIGFGGHVRREDDSVFYGADDAVVRRIYDAARERELREELIIGSRAVDRAVAVLNDDSNEVGRVHFGVVHLHRLAEPVVTKRESEITQLEFLSPEQLLAEQEQLETWSQICLTKIAEILRG